METPMLDLLNDFSYSLQNLSSKPLEKLEIILPVEQYKQFEYELQGKLSYGIPKEGKYNLQTINGINFKISCKELNDSLISNKLKECFKILSK